MNKSLEDMKKEYGMGWAQLPDRYTDYVDEYLEDLDEEDLEDLSSEDIFESAKDEEIISEDEDSAYDEWYITYADYQIKLKSQDKIEESADDYNSEEEIKERLKEINKQLAYIRRRDAVSLSIGSDEEQSELYSERNKLNGKLRKIRNKKVDIKSMTLEEQEAFKNKLKELELWDGTEENLPSAIQIYRAYHMKNESIEEDFDENISLQEATIKMLSEDDEEDILDLRDNMINELNEISEEDGLYWEANEMYDNCAITEDETDQYMEIFVFRDEKGNIKYSTDEEHADSYKTVEDAYNASMWHDYYDKGEY